MIPQEKTLAYDNQKELYVIIWMTLDFQHLKPQGSDSLDG